MNSLMSKIFKALLILNLTFNNIQSSIKKCSIACKIMKFSCFTASCLLTIAIARDTLNLHEICQANEECTCNIDFFDEFDRINHRMDHKNYKVLVNFVLPFSLFLNYKFYKLTMKALAK